VIVAAPEVPENVHLSPDPNGKYPGTDVFAIEDELVGDGVGTAPEPVGDGVGEGVGVALIWGWAGPPPLHAGTARQANANIAILLRSFTVTPSRLFSWHPGYRPVLERC